MQPVSAGSRQSEAGVAMIMAILIAVLVAIVIGVVAMSSIATSQNTRRDHARTASLEVASTAAQRIRQQLVESQASSTPGTPSGDGFAITADELAAALTATAVETRTSASSAYSDIDTTHGGVPLTAVGSEEAEGRRMWQIVQALMPTPDSPWLTLYVRGWVQIGDSATDAAVVKVRIRPGSIADYQIISDAPVRLDPGTTINGSIHSNGGLEEGVQLPSRDGNLRVWADGPVACARTAGSTPTVSTARGNIDLGGGDCTIKPATGSFVPLDSARESVSWMRRLCGTQTVTCVSGSADPDEPATVVLSGTSIRVSYPGKAPIVIAAPVGSSRAVVLDRDTRVSGTTSARVTIVAWRQGS